MPNTFNRDTSIPTANDIVQFAKDHRVSLEAGDYSLTLKPALTVNGSPIDPPLVKKQQDLAVRSERFQIPTNLVRSVYPAARSKGDFWNTLPHIVIERSTLPWERRAVSMGSDNQPPTWLALLVFNENDSPAITVNTKTVGDLSFLNQSRAENKAYENTPPSNPKMPWESGDKTDQQIHTISVPLKYLPSREELTPLTHVRRRLAYLSTYASKTAAEATFPNSVQPYPGQTDYDIGLPLDEPGASLSAAKSYLYKDQDTNEFYEILEYDDGSGAAVEYKLYHVVHEAATILASRLPQSGSQNTVHLVSVEHRYWEDHDTFEGRDPAEDISVELISLYQWSFYCEIEQFTFGGLLRGLNGGASSGQPGTLRLPKLSDSSEPFLQSGFVPLRHRFRDGSRSVSWYHGPLIPSTQRLAAEEWAPIPGLDFISEHSTLEEAKTALSGIVSAFDEVDNAISQLPDDVSEALSFKDTATQKLYIILQYQTGATPFRLFRAHKGDFMDIQQSDQLLTYDSTNGFFDVSYAAAWELGRALTLQNTKIAQELYNWKKSQKQQSNATRHIAEMGFHILGIRSLIPQKSGGAAVWQWLDELAQIKHIPFQYLVPDERMLPKESIRLFSIDQRWISCLQDGAFSIGRVSPAEAQADNALMHARQSNYQQSVLSGFLLRSKLVSAFPEAKIVGYSAKDKDGNPVNLDPAEPPASSDVPGLLPIAQRRVLGQDVLLVLFKGEVNTVDFFLPAEALHFGFFTDGIAGGTASDHPDKLTVRPRDAGTGEVKRPDGSLDFRIQLKSSNGTADMRLVNIKYIHDKLLDGSYLQGESASTPDVHSGTFALQLLLSHELIRFQRNPA